MNIKKFLVILIILAGFWYAFFGQKMLPVSESSAEAYLKTIKKVKSPDVLQLIQDKKGHLQLVHIFKSNCILCRIYFQDIVDTARQYPEIPVIVIATDRHPLLLASFLSGRNLPFTPLMLDDSPESLAGALKTIDMHYDDNEPYTVVIDRNGQVIEFSVGSGFASRISSYFEEKK